MGLGLAERKSSNLSSDHQQTDRYMGFFSPIPIRKWATKPNNGGPIYATETTEGPNMWPVCYEPMNYLFPWSNCTRVTVINAVTVSSLIHDICSSLQSWQYRIVISTRLLGWSLSILAPEPPPFPNPSLPELWS